MVTKDQLRKGDRVLYRGRQLVVKDLMNRRSYDRPGQIGVGPADRGWAMGVSLDEIEKENAS